MADDADRAAEYEAHYIEEAIRRSRQPDLPDRGHCHYCGKKWRDGRRFCDAECRDEYEIFGGI